MLHDEEIYPNPSTFRPERFLTEDGKLDPKIWDPTTVAFGFGGRSDLKASSSSKDMLNLCHHFLQDLSRQSYCMVHSLANHCYGANYDENHESTG